MIEPALCRLFPAEGLRREAAAEYLEAATAKHERGQAGAVFRFTLAQPTDLA